MLKKILIILLFFMLTVNNVFAKQEILIEISSNKDSIEVGSSFQLAISTKYASTDNMNIQEYNIPGLENFQQTGSSQSTQIQIVNGARTAISETVLTLMPKNVGKYEIGPIVLFEKGNKISESNVIKINVLEKTKKSFFPNDTDEKTNKNQVNNKLSIVKMIKNIFAFLLLVGMIYLLYKRSHNKDRQNIVINEIEEKDSSIQEKINIPDINDEKFFEKSKKCLLEFLEQKYQIEVESRTSKEIIVECNETALKDIEKINKILEKCDNARFMAVSGDREVIIEMLKDVIK